MAVTIEAVPYSEQNWNHYGIEELKLIVNGEDIGRRLIVKDGKAVPFIPSKSYRVLPNEEAVKVADQVADELGLKKFYEFIGDKNERGKKFENQVGHKFFKNPDDFKHVLFAHSDRPLKMHALYTFKEQVEIQKNDFVNVGISINNSIDGRSSFGVSLFTFREVCSNIFWHLGKKTSRRISDSNILTALYKAHMKSLDIDYIVKSIRQVIDSGIDVIAEYRSMTERKLLQKQAELIVQYLPRKMVKEAMPYIHVEEKANKVSLVKAPTIWNNFNDATGWTWHNAKTQVGTKMQQMKVIEAVYSRRLEQVA